MEENRLKGKGMTKDEFDYNKDLLKEIVQKKGDLLQNIEQTKNHLLAKSLYKPTPAYEVFSL